MTNTRWLAITFALLLGALCAGAGITWFAITVATAPGFPQLMFTPYNQVESYPFSLNHQNCEILIYGDSSAMTGVDPVKVEALTHRKTCNISQTQPTIVATGTLTVDLYLKHNALPKYLVIQLAPETFYQPHGLDTLAGFDPIMLMLRHDSGYATTKKLFQNPLPTVRFLSLVLQARYRPDRAYRASFFELYRQPIANYYAHSGFLTMPKASEGACGVARPLGTGDFGWIDEARRRYETEGNRRWYWSRLFRSAICRGKFIASWMRMWDGVSTTLPLELFNDSDRHYTAEGSGVVSSMVAQKILHLDRGAGN